MNLQGCSADGLHDVCESTDLLDHVAKAGVNASDPLASAASNVSPAGLYFGFCALISHVLLAGITAAVVHKCVTLKMVHTAGHAFYCTVGVSFLQIPFSNQSIEHVSHYSLFSCSARHCLCETAASWNRGWAGLT